MSDMSNSSEPCIVEGDMRLSPFRWVEALLMLEAFPATFFDDLGDARRVTVMVSDHTITARHGRNGRGDILVTADTDSAVIKCRRFGGKPTLRLPLQRRTIQRPLGALRIRLQSADLARLQQALASGSPVGD